MLKRLSIILPLLFALLSFKVSASILVLTGGVIQTAYTATDDKGKTVRHFTDFEQANIFEEYIEEGEEEEDEDSETSSSLYFGFYQTNRSESNSSQDFVCRNVKRKLFLLYHSYKIDCCKF
ncbi:MAG: hypothetical protein RLZZ71_100 [Bacteroidota bacterium]